MLKNFGENGQINSLYRFFLSNILSLTFPRRAAVGELHSNLCKSWSAYERIFIGQTGVLYAFFFFACGLTLDIYKLQIGGGAGLGLRYRSHQEGSAFFLLQTSVLLVVVGIGNHQFEAKTNICAYPENLRRC